MRFDRLFVFVSPEGLIEPLDGYKCQSVNWRSLKENFSKVAQLAKADWGRVYVVTQPIAGDDNTKQIKAVLEQTICSANLHPPATWYRDLCKTRRELLPVADRKLILGSRDKIAKHIRQVRLLYPRAYLFGLQELNETHIGYRNIGNVPRERLKLCVRSLFTSIITLGDVTPVEWIVDEAEAHGVPVDELVGRGARNVFITEAV